MVNAWHAQTGALCCQVAAGHAAALVAGMQLWELPGQLLAAGRPRAAAALLLRAFEAVSALGSNFFGWVSCHLAYQ